MLAAPEDNLPDAFPLHKKAVAAGGCSSCYFQHNLFHVKCMSHAAQALSMRTTCRETQNVVGTNFKRV